MIGKDRKACVEFVIMSSSSLCNKWFDVTSAASSIEIQVFFKKKNHSFELSCDVVDDDTPAVVSDIESD